MIAAVAPATLLAPDAATLTAAVDGEIVQLPGSTGGVVHWYGAELFFNRNETNNIVGGASLVGAAGGLASLVFKYVGGAIAAAGGYWAAWATWAQGAGMCFKLTVTLTYIPGRYSGGNCR